MTMSKKTSFPLHFGEEVFVCQIDAVDVLMPFSKLVSPESWKGIEVRNH